MPKDNCFISLDCMHVPIAVFLIASCLVGCTAPSKDVAEASLTNEKPASDNLKRKADQETAVEAKEVLLVKPENLVFFAALPKNFQEKSNISNDLIQLGRQLYFDKRLSKAGDISCQTCHQLETYGVDHLPTSLGHLKQQGRRNAPTVFHAAGHVAQFWDGRATSIEDQAVMPILNPAEMANHQGALLKTLGSIPGYVQAFRKAFPEEKKAITLRHIGVALGAFERELLTPSRFDAFLQGDKKALSLQEQNGLLLFTSVGCIACHQGALVGGAMFQKLGLVKPWPHKEDQGRFVVTGQEADRLVFKVPSLRNIEHTAPYFHNGEVKDLPTAVKLMAEYQLGRQLADAQVADIVAFLYTLSGTLPKDLIEVPVAFADLNRVGDTKKTARPKKALFAK